MKSGGGAAASAWRRPATRRARCPVAHAHRPFEAFEHTLPPPAARAHHRPSVPTSRSRRARCAVRAPWSRPQAARRHPPHAVAAARSWLSMKRSAPAGLFGSRSTLALGGLSSWWRYSDRGGPALAPLCASVAGGLFALALAAGRLIDARKESSSASEATPTATLPSLSRRGTGMAFANGILRPIRCTASLVPPPRCILL